MLGNYLIDIVRFLRMHGLFSLLKVLSLTTGIITFFIFWLYRAAPPGKIRYLSDWLQPEALADIAVAIVIFATMGLACSFMQKAQIKLRAKDMMMRKVYGENNVGIVALLAMETTITILSAMVLGLVILDQIIPYLNVWTGMHVSIRGATNIHLIVDYGIITTVLIVICTIVPSVYFCRARVVDMLHKNEPIIDPREKDGKQEYIQLTPNSPLACADT